MTNMEIMTHFAIQSIDGKTRDQNEIDWEQRRYEIAKEVMSGLLPFVQEEEDETGWMARRAVNYADALIEELKKERAQ